MENIKFKRATIVTDGEGVTFNITVMKQSGYFEIFESGAVVCTGYVRVPKDVSSEFKEKDGLKVSNSQEITLEEHDIYQECQLRRYMYKNYFRGLTECDLSGRNGRVQWKGKFGSFFDTMLHITIIGMCSRDSLLPTSIRQITVDPIKHMEMVDKNKEELPITYNTCQNIIKSGGVEIIGTEYSKAPRRQHTQEPPYCETYSLVNYSETAAEYDLETAMSTAMQIILQNNTGTVKQVKICEIMPTQGNREIDPIVKNIMAKQVLSKIEYFSSRLENLKDKFQAIIINDKEVQLEELNKLVNNLTENGFILFKGSFEHTRHSSLEIIFESVLDNDKVYLLKPTTEVSKNYAVLNISNTNLDWLENLKNLGKINEEKTVYLVSQNEDFSGIIGLTKCLLTETTKLRFRAFFIDQHGSKFSVNDPFYKNQIKKDLTFNVLSNNKWGTYVHLPLRDLNKQTVGNAAVDISTLGDLSTIEWTEMAFEGRRVTEESEMVYVYYSALNFRDVMVALGKVPIDSNDNVPTKSSGMGLEFSGISASGKRIMGFVNGDALALQVQYDPYFTWEIPNDWSLREACTIPCVYATVSKLHTYIISIGFQQNVVSDKTHTWNSRDLSFEIMIKNNTNGRGVDLVLNSLADTMFQASMRCVAPGGRFIEIGKVDLMNSSPIPSSMFLKNICFHGVHLDKLFSFDDRAQRQIQQLVAKDFAGIFNSALVLKDQFFLYQTKENFYEVFKPKILSAQNIDKCSRKLCPDLNYFVVFSSISTGRGNIGQINYGMANSAMEMLCEKRRRENLPAVAIQWGPIGEVGILQKMGIEERVFHDILPQNLDSCLNTLERFMVDEYVIGSSVVISERDDQMGKQKTKTPVEAVAHILGIKNLDTIDKSLTLSQLGLDSLMVTEIKQTLYRNFNIDLSPEEIRELTLNSLVASDSTKNEDISFGVQVEANTYLISDDPLIKLRDSKSSNTNIFVIHPIEGHVNVLRPLGSRLNATVYGLQCTSDTEMNTMNDFGKYFVKKIKEVQPKGPYHLCGYSYGCALGTEIGIQLESAGDQVDVVYIDGSPSMVHEVLKVTHITKGNSVENSKEAILENFCMTFPQVEQKEIKACLSNEKSLDKKLQSASELISKVTGIDQLKVLTSANSLIQRIEAGFFYKPSKKLSGSTLLIRRNDNPFSTENYDLNQVCNQAPYIEKIDGDHKTILLGNNTQKVADIINKFCKI
uniref:oleoyl-[acyl-carrier-protein] hydrolase n=1 Tax=Diabrotica virgifera virgifera TaxID=50390 RepID=A0A6P7F9W8_DIAVI